MTRKTAYLALVLLSFTVISLNYLWLKQNRMPVGSDMAIHARYAMENKLDIDTQHKLGYTFDKMMHWGPSRYYPPFFYDAAYFFLSVFGVTLNSVVMTNSFFIVIFIFSVFFIGEKTLKDTNLSVMAAALIFTFPLLNDSTRQCMLDFALASMSACAFALLIYNDEFQNTWRTALFAVVCGFGILTKWFLPTFLFFPVVYVLIRGFKKNAWRTAVNLLIFMGITLLIAEPWFQNSGMLKPGTINSPTFQGGAPRITLSLLAGNLSLKTLFYYMAGLYEFSAVIWLFFIVGLIFSFRRDVFKNYIHVFLLFLSSLTFWYLMIKTKEPRYNLVHLVPVAMILLSPALSLKKGGLRKPYLAVLSVFLLVLYSAVTFGFPKMQPGKFKKLFGYPDELMLKWASRRGPPDRRYWPTNDVFKTITADWERSGAGALRHARLKMKTIDITGIDKIAIEFYSLINKIDLYENPADADYLLIVALNRDLLKTGYADIKKQGFRPAVSLGEFKLPELPASYNNSVVELYAKKAKVANGKNR